MRSNPTLFGDARMTWLEAIELTAESLHTHGAAHAHWVFAFSGGKDSTATLTIVMYLIESGRVPRPERITVCFADTRMELLPLLHSAQRLMNQLREIGVDVRTVMAPLDERFYVYMFGRGIPPPNNRTFRWCTAQIKVEPMQAEIRRIVGESAGRVLMITGVRQGESAMRDDRIAMSCGRDGAECGQGWYQTMTGDGFATLAPILHMRVCHVWDWLKIHAPRKQFGGWYTQDVADAYGGDDAEEVNARTGCVGCALTESDLALDTVIAVPRWSYLAPLKELRPLYRELREQRYRLRQPPGESRKDGTLVRNQNRMGPITIQGRRMALARVLDIQSRCNAARGEMPAVDLLNEEEVARIEELITANTWPNKWNGTEPRADEPYLSLDASGSLQLALDWEDE